MPITVEEHMSFRRSRAGIAPAAEVRYRVFGTESDIEAREAVGAVSLQGFDVHGTGAIIIPRTDIEATLIDGLRDAWDVTVYYTDIGVDTPEESFETGGATRHITQSLQTISRTAPAGGAAPNLFGAIGYTGRPGELDGTEIVIPSYNFAHTYFKTDAQVTTTYKGQLFAATGTVNNASFKGFAAGEVLFLGATGARRADGIWPITFRFAALPNQTGLTVGSITVPSKKGWEYLWIYYEPTEDTVAKRTVPTPVAAYVEKVYRDANFASLGIGT